jgi:hydrogenase nickel incorporation protein HypA/HybF
MHELSVTQGVLDVVLNAAAEAGAERIYAIHLVIGDLSSIVDESVQFYFDFLSRDTLAAGAALHFKREAAMLHCAACGAAHEANIPLATVCPTCGSAHLRVSGGRSFYIESIEVNDDHPSGEGNSERE